ncbi:peptide ABC transporter substrate-binding protein [Altererythrobacter aerius]|uniref:Peptide ABC transporter substrate-binding protein n=1 Tax=Tsuneonella aeria TaxID=1837929 RepID=A0A6I4TGJ2_9SPHN|nr:ABC transporter substrate-binding protein [Tsuneonella aeria]MXO75628.1 peptide ABC transporter substrate-binding protein [Tsuneonella aeria]
MRRSCLAILSAFLLPLVTGCDRPGDGSTIGIAFIDEPDAPFARGLRLPPAAQQVRAATAEGLVALDATGAVVPALAERWIVTDDGLSYIFRLRNSDWQDGSPIEAEEVRDSLRQTIRALGDTSLGLDFAPVTEVRAMTGRVIEIRLASPVPDFLQLLAQPEMGVLHRGQGAGPMTLTRDRAIARLALMPPDQRGLPTREDWQDGTRRLAVRALPAARAVAAFREGEVDLVLDGRLASLPLADVGPLSRGTVRLDGAQGLMGFHVANPEGLLADAGRREALSMALERETLMAPFNIAGWLPSTRIVPSQAAGDAPERWADLAIEERRGQAIARIAAYDGPKTMRVALPAGPGSDLLFRELAADWAEIGVTATQVPEGEPADLVFVDTLSRYGGRAWFLNQFACAVRRTLCSPEADALVQQAASEVDPVARGTMLAEAEARLAAQAGYIPLGAPVRWSLVRGDIGGFAENRWGLHPLLPLALGPT